MKSAFGFTTRHVFELRLEKTQNLVSTNVPEVIESLNASCNGIGMAMTEVATSAVCELFEVEGKLRAGTRFGRGWLSLAPMRNLGSQSARGVK
jgi:hypothetical protein